MLAPRIVFLASCLMLSGVSAPVLAADKEPAWLSLFDRETLAGWTYAPQGTEGWQMAKGVLSGEPGAAPLLSGWTWGDLELRFRWSAADGAELVVALPEAPEGSNELTLSLAEGKHAGSLRKGDQILSPGGKIGAAKDGWHDALFRRAHDRLSLTIDGQQLEEVRIPAKTRYGLGLRVAKGRVEITELAAREPAGEPVYNGKDLSGWWTPGKLDGWAALPEGIACLNKDGNYLRTEKEYANFTLTLSYKMAKGGNSGIGIRTARAGWPSGDGMELQLLDEKPNTPLTRHSTMALYGNLEPIAKADRSQAWNQLAIKAEGYMISAWVNGALVQQVNTARLPELHRRNLKGWIGLQDHNAAIEFRGMRVLEAPDGPGLETWYAPATEPASKQVLDRLMNPETLAIDDALKSGLAYKKIEHSGKQVLAELKGPGALVEISRTNNSGKLSFYFDGEETPRIACEAGSLHQQLPLVGQDQQPLLTFVAYQKELKVVLETQQPVEYRLDYVTFPADAPLSELRRDDSGVARGMLPALSYRNEQLGWGTHREADPLPRQSASPKAIKPGDRQTLIELKDAGVVQWTKLQVNPAVLANDDLWLEVVVDGQKEPAILAPARYLYPGLAGKGGNYPNYVLVDRGGLTNMLAMPYRAGLTMTAINRGQQMISGVGAAVSYEPLTDIHDPRLQSKLYGVFRNGRGEAARDLIVQSRRGRWIGLVMQSQGVGESAVESLAVDGVKRESWSGLPWPAFLGFPAGDGEVRHSLCGRRGGLVWRYLLLEPLQFQQSLHLRASQPLGDRLALFYLE